MGKRAFYGSGPRRGCLQSQCTPTLPPPSPQRSVLSSSRCLTDAELPPELSQTVALKQLGVVTRGMKGQTTATRAKATTTRSKDHCNKSKGHCNKSKDHCNKSKGHYNKAVRKQPKDGAIICTCAGTVIAAAARIDHSPVALRIPERDGRNGTSKNAHSHKLLQLLEGTHHECPYFEGECVLRWSGNLRWTNRAENGLVYVDGMTP